MRRFNYQPTASPIFGIVRRPLVSLDLYSPVKKQWVPVTNLLADTGADLSIFPRAIGELLLGDIQRGRSLTIRGIVPGALLKGDLHRLSCKFNGRPFRLLVAIADSEDVTAVLGRVGGLDRLIATFLKGYEVRLSKP